MRISISRRGVIVAASLAGIAVLGGYRRKPHRFPSRWR